MCQSYAFQESISPTTTPCQPWTDHSAPPPPPVTSEPLFQLCCMFCSHTNHHIKECPLAHKYIRTGKAIVIGNWIHLPNGQAIPSSLASKNLQAKINSWITRTVANAPTHPPEPSFTCDTLPHATHSFKIRGKVIYGKLVQQAHMVEVQDVNEEQEDDSNDEDFPDLFDIYAMEQRKWNTKASQLPEFTHTKAPKEP